MKMAKVIKCEVDDCVYNKDQACRTLGITVGYRDQTPYCLTFGAR
jgi:hypothetical protein